MMMSALVESKLKNTIAIREEYFLKRKHQVAHANSGRLCFINNLILLLISFSLIVFIPEKPQDSADVCNKYYSENACNIF